LHQAHKVVNINIMVRKTWLERKGAGTDVAGAVCRTRLP
jgi:hypothetical protein